MFYKIKEIIYKQYDKHVLQKRVNLQEVLDRIREKGASSQVIVIPNTW